MEIQRQVGENVARLRRERKISQTQLASRLGQYKLGVTQGYISELEAGRKNPTLLTLAAIAQALDVGIATLFQNLS